MMDDAKGLNRTGYIHIAFSVGSKEKVRDIELLAYLVGELKLVLVNNVKVGDLILAKIEVTVHCNFGLGCKIGEELDVYVRANGSAGMYRVLEPAALACAKSNINAVEMRNHFNLNTIPNIYITIS